MERIQANIDSDGNLPAFRQAYVEFLEAGQWRKYSSASVKHSNALVLHKFSHAVGLAPLLDDHSDNQDRLKAHEMDTDPYMVHSDEVDDIVPSFHDSNTIYRPLSPQFNFGEFLTNPMNYFVSPGFAQTYTSSVDDDLLTSLPVGPGIMNGDWNFPSFLVENSMNSPIQKGIMPDKDHQGIVLGRSASASRTHSQLEGARSLITSLVQHSKTSQCFKPGTTEIPGVEEITESSQSLLPDPESPSQEVPAFTLCVTNVSSYSTLFKTLLYSFANNMAGLRDVPRKALMQLLREHHDIRTKLFEIVKNGPPGVAKPLADNMFRAAVEGCDANAVATIIHHTKGNPKIGIDPNEVVCNLGGHGYIPIEVAANFRKTELVRTLVASSADPNKTCEQRSWRLWEQGALALALGHWENGSKVNYRSSPPGEPETVNIDLLRLLLDCGAKVREDLVLNAMRPGPNNTIIAEELVSRIPASDHRVYFESEWLLISIIQYLASAAANTIVRRIFAHCSESTDCGRCASECPRLVERTLCHAARRSNLDLSRLPCGTHDTIAITFGSSR